jgi:hypothetical protein
MNKYEQLIEHIINDETDKARELFHNIVVEKSRDIYESLIDETDLDEVGGNKVQGFIDEVNLDEQGISEEDEEAGEFELGGEEEGELENDFDNSGELDTHEEEHGDVETRVDDLESALDELKAEFDALMAGEEGEAEHADMFGGEEEFGSEEVAPEEFYEAEECDTEEDEEEVEESIVREYVEKVAAPSNTEGADNKQSTVAKKNDMGGSSANIVRGGTENGGNVKKPTVNNLGNINVPGGKAGSAFKGKAAPKAGEGQTTDGKVPVATKSPLAR